MNDDSEIRDKAIHFEAVKIAMNQDKNGWILKLSIHPNEVPHDLINSWVGTRYTTAMVQLNDQDEPVAGPDTREGAKAVAAAGRLCRNPRFWQYLANKTDEIIDSEEPAVEALKFLLDIESRSDLKSDPSARLGWDRLVADFMHSVQVGDL